jgi:hypothetical protein
MKDLQRLITRFLPYDIKSAITNPFSRAFFPVLQEDIQKSSDNLIFIP